MYDYDIDVVFRSIVNDLCDVERFQQRPSILRHPRPQKPCNCRAHLNVISVHLEQYSMPSTEAYRRYQDPRDIATVCFNGFVTSNGSSCALKKLFSDAET